MFCKHRKQENLHAACELSVENTGTAGIVGARLRRVAERNGAGRAPRNPGKPLAYKSAAKFNR